MTRRILGRRRREPRKCRHSRTKTARQKNGRILESTVIAVIVTVLVTSLFYKPELVFLTEARTEIIWVKSQGVNLPSLEFCDVQVKTDIGWWSFSGVCKLDTGVVFKIQRISTSSLYFVFEDPQERATLSSTDSAFEISPSKPFRVKIGDIPQRLQRGQSVAFNLQGDIAVGDAVPDPDDRHTCHSVGTPLLRSGMVTILAKNIMGEDLHSVGTYDLTVGEVFEVDWKASANHPSLAVVLCDEGPGLLTVMRAQAKQVKVWGYKRTGYKIEVPIWHRLKHDRFVQTLWIFFGFLITVWKTLRKWRLRAKAETP